MCAYNFSLEKEAMMESPGLADQPAWIKMTSFWFSDRFSLKGVRQKVTYREDAQHPPLACEHAQHIHKYWRGEGGCLA